ncbi:hypothetical protein LEP1GSC062_0441 [Leptospira alexanderi serovar Manhao 3 str. L 60]|uniref:Uncharacterized protein n=1 Tax=Leptospira alexanderi serovar Manhao 3 str. L 60 TaxID=1049759 RepID=V6I2J4_9LEPT|nr:hypothetical protein LEP1GSC062_0441 [Leptospira alexanderi serovar Manhao 3 str. L 60]
MHAPVKEVWKQITSPFVFGEADHFFFRNGISYPVSMNLIQENARSLLAVDYSNGATIAAVTTLVSYSPKLSYAELTLVTTRYVNSLGPKFYWKLLGGLSHG